jgi:hypothetical protein
MIFSENINLNLVFLNNFSEFQNVYELVKDMALSVDFKKIITLDITKLIDSITGVICFTPINICLEFRFFEHQSTFDLHLGAFRTK